MSLRPPAGFIRPGYDPLKVPDAPTGATATGGDASASVAFTAPTNVGGSAVSAYYAVSNPDQITGTGASSPVSVTGLTNGTAYTFAVWALNTYGPSPYSAASGSVSPAAPRAFFAAGYVSGNYQNVIDYVNISTIGNASDWGDLSANAGYMGSAASSTRGLFIGHNLNRSIVYITFSSQGNSSYFGDMPNPDIGPGTNGPAGSGTRGMLLQDRSYTPNQMQYVTIATTGNSSNFGNLTVARYRCAVMSNPTQTFICGGERGSASYSNVIDYFTTASTGNATDFGDCNQSTQTNAVGGGSSTRGLIIAGSNFDFPYPLYILNQTSYITFASAGNAAYFGDLYNGTLTNASGASSSTRMLVGGGETYSTAYNVIQYITIATTGNSQDFGDLTMSRYNLGCVSNAHGGTQ